MSIIIENPVIIHYIVMWFQAKRKSSTIIQIADVHLNKKSHNLEFELTIIMSTARRTVTTEELINTNLRVNTNHFHRNRVEILDLTQ